MYFFRFVDKCIWHLSFKGVSFWWWANLYYEMNSSSTRTPFPFTMNKNTRFPSGYQVHFKSPSFGSSWISSWIYHVPHESDIPALVNKRSDVWESGNQITISVSDLGLNMIMLFVCFHLWYLYSNTEYSIITRIQMERRHNHWQWKLLASSNISTWNKNNNITGWWYKREYWKLWSP